MHARGCRRRGTLWCPPPPLKKSPDITTRRSCMETAQIYFKNKK